MTASAFPCSHRLLSNTSASPASPTPSNSNSEFVPTDDFATPTDSPFETDAYASDPSLFDVTPHTGYLRELGLDYGIGTTTLVQNVVELAYVYGPFSWGVTIVGVVFAFRLGMFKFAFDAADMSTRLQATKALTKDVDARLKEAVYNKDLMARQLAVQEKQAIYRAAGIKMRKIFLNMLINVPIGFSTFRLMRGMSTLPVPGLETGGLLWVQDLTIPDPYWILPTATALLLYRSFTVR